MLKPVYPVFDAADHAHLVIGQILSNMWYETSISQPEVTKSLCSHLLIALDRLGFTFLKEAFAEDGVTIQSTETEFRNNLKAKWMQQKAQTTPIEAKGESKLDHPGGSLGEWADIISGMGLDRTSPPPAQPLSDSEKSKTS